MNPFIHLQNTLDFIEENLKAEFTAAELANQAGYSLFHFYRLFQQATGMPVMQFIQRRKLLHAAYEIQSGKRRMDVILSYGFETYAGFYRSFRRMFSCTPSEYLRKGRAKKPVPVKLNQEDAMHITHKKATEMLKHWNLENELVSDIYYNVNGNRNENAYAVGSDYVLKFTNNLGKVLNHQSLATALHEAGLQSALPIQTKGNQNYVQDGDVYFHLTKKVQGTQMDSLKMYQDQNASFVGEIIAQMHLALEGCDNIVNEADLLSSVEEWALEGTKKALELSDAYCEDFLARFKSLYSLLPRQCIHRDPNPGNIIVNGDAWGFIDFELSEKNIRLFDPCYAATSVLSETFEREEAKGWLQVLHDILEGYDQVNPLTKKEKEAIPYVILANQMICVAWFATQEKFRSIYEVNLKMTRWLMNHFDAMKMQ